jgi:class 3 adenylate cyclase
MAVLFTDLKDSTALYARHGDALAYSLVHQHFAGLRACVTQYHGRSVKSIGDAVMAVFPQPAEAVHAALAMQQTLGALNQAHAIDPPLILKIGIHYGTVIALQTTHGLDYFGQTVNLAARVQGESVGGDIVVTATLLRTLLVLQALQGLPTPQPFTARLKGIEGEVRLYRLVV